jgi:transposase InsO family protein
MVFFAFVIDVFSRMVVVWQLACHMRTGLVLDAPLGELSGDQPKTLGERSAESVPSRREQTTGPSSGGPL